jgi:plastocyanin
VKRLRRRREPSCMQKAGHDFDPSAVTRPEPSLLAYSAMVPRQRCWASPSPCCRSISNITPWPSRAHGAPRPAPASPFLHRCAPGGRETDRMSGRPPIAQTIRTANRRVERHDEYAFSPARATVAAGAAVTLRTRGRWRTRYRPATARGRLAPVEPGESARVTMTMPGEYESACSDHLWSMGDRGEIETRQ